MVNSQTKKSVKGKKQNRPGSRVMAKEPVLEYEYHVNGNGYGRPVLPQEPKTWDARNLHLPTLTIIALIGFCIWGTWTVVSQKGDIDKRIDKVSATVEQLAISVKNLIPAIQNKGWTEKDQVIWCLKAAQKNPNWSCPESSISRENDQTLNLQLENQKIESILKGVPN